MPLPAENLLSAEASPYLRQHKDNPVHWRPWSKDALAEAKETGRPILLSIGYAACHWCHVMAHESFEDESVAALMNRLFVNIKVDREERPDIDQIYMAALTATGEQGGWPLTMFLTPEAQPFWGGTYFPKEPRYGRAGFTQILDTIHRAWQEKKSEITADAARLTAHVERQLAQSRDPSPLSDQQITALAEPYLAAIDPLHGGLTGAPKFPNAPIMTTLWMQWLESGDARYRDAVLHSLRSMLNGGIYDHVGGGLCRYSTDAEWMVPHFEKMLYDNAQLLTLCGWAYGATGEKLFQERIEQTISWLSREMRVGDGAFASSLDADSDGEEGKFYTWTPAEIEAALGKGAVRLLKTYSLASPPGWEGDPILHRSDPQTTDEDARQDLPPLLESLRSTRENRIRPGRDDKILVDWNGLAIRAIAQCARQFDRPDWLEIAEAAYRTVAESICEDRLPHSVLGEKKLYPGLSSDYAAIANAAVSLYEATGQASYLEDAHRMVAALDRWHADPAGTGYYLSASDSADVIMRVRGDVDDAMPSANAQVIEAIARLACATGDADLAAKAFDSAASAVGRAIHQRYGQAGIVNTIPLATSPRKLVMVEPRSGARFVPEANRTPDPRRIDLPLRHSDEPSKIALPGGAEIDPSKPAAYLCIGMTCLPPMIDPAALRGSLKPAS
ncbi:MAG: thioredoxin domain-containing protein [Hyphomicrobiales bacterium]|nr:thioredoxin domain-containing protein [Hyphomicrobiales bacterium]